MNYYGAKDLTASFRTVRKNTVIIAEEIPEDKYSFRPVEACRTVAELLTHIALSPSFMQEVNFVQKRSTMDGFDYRGLIGRVEARAKEPRTKAEIIALLNEEGEEFAKALESLSDDFLGQDIAMPPGGTPPSRTRFDMLMSVKEHEMHHRGQLMLIERMLGITPHLTRERNARFAAMEAAALATKA